jgi:hypothetical protein
MPLYKFSQFGECTVTDCKESHITNKFLLHLGNRRYFNVTHIVKVFEVITDSTKMIMFIKLIIAV